MALPEAACVLYFDDEAAPALRLAQAAGLPAQAIERHQRNLMREWQLREDDSFN